MSIELKDMTEREILIQQAGTLDKLCSSLKTLTSGLKTLTDDNTVEHKEIKTKVHTISDGKISNRLFFWVVGFILLFIMGLTGYTGVIKNDVVKNTTCIERMENHKQRR